MALPLKYLAHDFLGFTERVNVGGVDEVAAFFLRISHDAARIVQRGLVAEHHGAQAQTGNF